MIIDCNFIGIFNMSKGKDDYFRVKIDLNRLIIIIINNNN
jgi:hypothetical protein